MNTMTLHALLGMSLIAPLTVAAGQAETRHVWEKVEITLQSQRAYENPYTDVQVWLDLKGPNFDGRCYGFWDVLSEGRRYQDLVPSVERLSPSRSGKTKSLDGWAYCAATSSRDLVLLYFEQDCPQATLSGLPAGQNYEVHWYDPRTGRWLEAPAAAETLTVTADGTLRLPPFPGGRTKSDTDWALKLRQ